MYAVILQESGNLDARLGPMRHQQPAQRGGRGNASRLQPVSRDASFGSGSAGCIPEAGAGAGASGAATAGGSSSGRRSPEGGHHHPTFGQSLRTGSFRFQVGFTALLCCAMMTCWGYPSSSDGSMQLAALPLSHCHAYNTCKAGGGLTALSRAHMDVVLPMKQRVSCAAGHSWARSRCHG